MKPTIAIIGGGASAIMLAATLNNNKFDVTIYEQKGSIGRKFLVAGDGGLNITHSEPLQMLKTRYTPASFFENILNAFSNLDLQNWLNNIGIQTFVGSSKRVFPNKGIKPIEVLTAFIQVLNNNKIAIKTNYTWKGWHSKALLFEHNQQLVEINADITVLALGGSSWKITGSNGLWVTYFKEKAIDMIPFEASNCAFKIEWTEQFIETEEGKQLKNIAISCGQKVKRGEVVITKFGIEGGAIYALSTEIRQLLKAQNKAQIFIDLKPTLTNEQIKTKLFTNHSKTIKQQLTQALNLNQTQINLLKATLSKQDFINLDTLALKIKKLPITITAAAPLNEAISTVGGIALSEIDDTLQLKKLPNTYCIGEMLDWDAPTGGYLLQGCFSMGNFLGKHLNKTTFNK